MDNGKKAGGGKAAAGKKPSALPSKPLSFSGQATSKKGGKGGNASVSNQKKGGVNLMRKLSGM